MQTQEDALNYSKTFLSPTYFLQYSQLFDKAADAVKNDPVLLDRVNDARLSLDYYAVKLFKIKGQDILGNLSPSMKNNLRQRFKNSVKRLKVKFTADANQQPIDKYLDAYVPAETLPKAAVATVMLAAGGSYIGARKRKKSTTSA